MLGQLALPIVTQQASQETTRRYKSGSKQQYGARFRGYMTIVVIVIVIRLVFKRIVHFEICALPVPEASCQMEARENVVGAGVAG